MGRVLTVLMLLLAGASARVLVVYDEDSVQSVSAAAAAMSAVTIGNSAGDSTLEFEVLASSNAFTTSLEFLDLYTQYVSTDDPIEAVLSVSSCELVHFLSKLCSERSIAFVDAACEDHTIAHVDSYIRMGFSYAPLPSTLALVARTWARDSVALVYESGAPYASAAVSTKAHLEALGIQVPVFNTVSEGFEVPFKQISENHLSFWIWITSHDVSRELMLHSAEMGLVGDDFMVVGPRLWSCNFVYDDPSSDSQNAILGAAAAGVYGVGEPLPEVQDEIQTTLATVSSDEFVDLFNATFPSLWPSSASVSSPFALPSCLQSRSLAAYDSVHLLQLVSTNDGVPLTKDGIIDFVSTNGFTGSTGVVNFTSDGMDRIFDSLSLDRYTSTNASSNGDGVGDALWVWSSAATTRPFSSAAVAAAEEVTLLSLDFGEQASFLQDSMFNLNTPSVLPPTVSSVSPTHSDPVGGTRLTVHGDHFWSTHISVSLGDSFPCTIISQTVSQIVCLTSPGYGRHPVNLLLENEITNQMLVEFQYNTPIPSVVTTQQASPDDLVTIKGMYFDGPGIIKCRFTSASGESRIVDETVIQSLVSDDGATVTCLMPLFTELDGGEALTVALSNDDGRHFSAGYNILSNPAWSGHLPYPPSLTNNEIGGTLIVITLEAGTIRKGVEAAVQYAIETTPVRFNRPSVFSSVKFFDILSPDWADQVALEVETSNVIAVVGGPTSDSSVVLLDILSGKDIPVVSYGATSTTLTSATDHPQFVRVVHSNDYLAKTIVGILAFHEIAFVSLLGGSEVYNYDLFERVQASADIVGIDILGVRHIPSVVTTEEEFKEAARSALSELELLGTRVVVVAVAPGTVDLLVGDVMVEMGVIGGEDPWAVILDDSLVAIDETIVGGGDVDGLVGLNVLLDLPQWFTFGVTEVDPTLSASTITQHSPLSFDAMTMLELAVTKVMAKPAFALPLDPADVLEELRSITFEGVTGEIIIDSGTNDRTYVNHAVQNIVEGEWRVTHSTNDVGSIIEGEDIVWLTGSTEYPRDRQRNEYPDEALVVVLDTPEIGPLLTAYVAALNDNSHILPHTKISFEWYSSADVENRTQALLDWKSRGAVAIVGPDSSYQAIPWAIATRGDEVGESVKIPMISYLATSPTLSDSELYPYFSRVVSNDFSQAEALASLLATYGITSVSVVYTPGDPYEEPMKDAFVQVVAGMDIEITCEIVYNTNTTALVEEIFSCPSTAVLLSLTEPWEVAPHRARDILEASEEYIVDDRDLRVWLGVDGWFWDQAFQSESSSSAGHGAIGTFLVDPIQVSASNELHELYEAHWGETVDELPWASFLVLDAFEVAVTGLHNLLHGRGASRVSTALDIEADTMNSFIRNVTLSGLSGPIWFDGVDRAVTHYTMLNWNHTSSSLGIVGETASVTFPSQVTVTPDSETWFEQYGVSVIAFGVAVGAGVAAVVYYAVIRSKKKSPKAMTLKQQELILQDKKTRHSEMLYTQQIVWQVSFMILEMLDIGTDWNSSIQLFTQEDESEGLKFVVIVLASFASIMFLTAFLFRLRMVLLIRKEKQKGFDMNEDHEWIMGVSTDLRSFAPQSGEKGKTVGSDEKHSRVESLRRLSWLNRQLNAIRVGVTGLCLEDLPFTALNLYLVFKSDTRETAFMISLFVSLAVIGAKLTRFERYFVLKSERSNLRHALFVNMLQTISSDQVKDRRLSRRSYGFMLPEEFVITAEENENENENENVTSESAFSSDSDDSSDYGEDKI